MRPMKRTLLGFLLPLLLLLATRSESASPGLRIEVGPQGPPIANGMPIEGDRLSDLLGNTKEPVTIVLARSAAIDRLVDIFTGPGGRQLVSHANLAVVLPAPSGRPDTARITVPGVPAVVWLNAGTIRVSSNGDSLFTVDGVEDLHSFAAMSLAKDPSQAFVLAVHPKTDSKLVDKATIVLRRANVVKLYHSVDDGFELIQIPTTPSTGPTEAQPTASIETSAEAELEEMRRNLLAEMSRLEESSNEVQAETGRTQKETADLNSPQKEKPGQADSDIQTEEPKRDLEDRFRDLGNGILRDSVKPLEWTRQSSSRITWKDATQHCERLRTGGHKDWRLPTLGELQLPYSMDFSETRCGDVTCRIYPQFELSGPLIWSSDLDGPSKAFLFNFFWGERSSADVGVHPERTLCVRVSAG